MNRSSRQFRWLLFFFSCLLSFAIPGTALHAQTVSLGTTNLNFGNQATGTTSSAKTVRLTNTGTAPLLISGITKPSAPFSESDNCPISPASLARRAFCTISATFGPTTSGSFGGSISITDSATSSPQVITLQGTGIQQAVLSPTSFSFGSQGLGTTSSVKTITLTNNLSTPLTFTAVASGDFRTATAPNNPCGVSVPASGHCSIGLTFSPTQLGARTGTLTVTDNASNSPQTASLTGTGSTASLISLSVSPLNPSIAVGGTQAFMATGTFPGNISLGVTTLVRWSSSAKKIASISNVSPNQGVATGSSLGSATITARLSGVSSSTALSVGVSKTNQTITFSGTPGTAAYGSNFAVSATASSGLLVTISASGACTISGNTVTVTSGAGTCTLTASQAGNATFNAAPNVIKNVAATPATAAFIGLSPSQSITFGFASITLSGTVSAGSISPSAETVSIAINGTSVTPTIGSGGSFSAVFATAAIPVSTTPYLITYTYAGDGNFSGASDSSTTLTVTAASGVFVPTGSINVARIQATATLLNNGMVLIAGGIATPNDGPALASAELYDPGTGTFTSTGSLNTGRFETTATLLNNGMVLIAGGLGEQGLLSSAELYDPATGTFTPTGSLNIPRDSHTATLLNNGMVLIADGEGAHNLLASAELYDPATGTFTTIGSPTLARTGHTATLLNNGMVLIAGGLGDQGYLSSAELYDPATGLFTPTGSLNLARVENTATLLNNGMVLIAGGGNVSSLLSSAELYDPATGLFTATGSMNLVRFGHTATLLNNGMMLIAGGANTSGALSSAELYDPTTGSFTLTGSLNTGGYLATATLLNNGKVLIAAREDSSGALSSSELYEPATLIPQNLVSIAVSPVSPTIPLGATQRFIATGTFSDNSTEQLATVTWTSSSNAIATITGDVTNLGAADALAIGSTTISACTGTLCVSTTLAVTAPVLVSIAVTPANPSIAFSAVQQFSATGNYSDGTTQNLTSAATWSSSATGVATINAAGLATGLLGGSTTITATSGSISGTATLTVLAPPTLVSISLGPDGIGIPLGFTQQYTAVGNYSDGTMQDLTGTATWTSSATSVATINSEGRATGVGGGFTTITATVGSISATASLEVTLPPTLISILVTPANPSIALSAMQQFTATGIFSNGLTQNLTSTATWRSSTPSVATINSGGVATGVGGGSATITATSGSAGGSTTLTVGPVGVFIPTGSMNNVRYDHTATLLNNGMVLMTGGDDFTIGALSSAELYSPATGKFTNTGSLIMARGSQTATLLNNGMVLIAGGQGADRLLSSAELYNPATGRFIPTGSLNIARGFHTATHLNNGMVLIVGGFDDGNILSSAELYDPATGTFSPTGRLITARYGHTATLLNNGMVLIAGGTDGNELLSSAELYDPTQGGFTTIGFMSSPREYHTATLLNDGMVLITGGTDGDELLSSAEVYDPTVGGFGLTNSMGSPRESHTATLLNDGTVLIAGGDDGTTIGLNSAELYNPATLSFTPASGMNTARDSQTATLLQNGTVLVGGGENLFGPLSSAELYEPFTHTPYNLVSIAVSPVSPTIPVGATQRFIATGTFSDNSTEQLSSVTWTSSSNAIATITGDVTNLGAADALAIGSTTISACTGTQCGSTTLTVAGAPPPTLVSISVNPTGGTISPGLTLQFSATGTYTDGTTQDLTTSVVWSSSPPGVVMIDAAGLATGLSGGIATITATSGSISGTATLTVFAPPTLVSVSVTPANPSITVSTTLQFTATGNYSDGTTQNLTNTATWSSSVTGVATIDIAGIAVGVGGGSTTITAALGSINGSTTLTVTSTTTSSFVPTGSLNTARASHTATLLNNGKVLIAAGTDSGAVLTSAELYDPATRIFTFTGSLNTSRESHTATLLNNGMVLIAGGGASESSAELYDSAAGTFTLTGSMNAPRENHTATLLNNGMVLIAGGLSGPAGGTDTALSSAELYDPATGTFSPTGNMNSPRYHHTATLLNNGMVLITGGDDFINGSLSSAELYDPATGTFASTGSMSTTREQDTATLLNNGMVLIAGGFGDGFLLASAELFDPATGTFSPTGNLNAGRFFHTATLLNNGMVLIAGGDDFSSPFLSSAELYDPSTGAFAVTGSMNTARVNGPATLLSDGTGQVLIAGGFDNSFSYVSSAELYVPATMTPPNLVSVTLTPTTPVLSVGATQRFIATGTFSDQSTERMASVTWKSSNSAIATITDDATNLGAADAIAGGSTTISACAGPLCGSTTLTVPGSLLPTLVSIDVAPPSGTILAGLTLQFGATGKYTDGTTKDLTTSVVWSLSAPSVATINSAGLATGLIGGSTTIAAASGAISGTATLTVVFPPTLVSISVTPANLLIALSAMQQFTATGTYSDGSMQDFTSTATWSSSAASVATINSAGIAAGVGGGSTTITATSSSISGSTSLTVVSSSAFAPTGSLNTAREGQTATLLDDGTVLVAGGLNTAYMSSAELYDPTLGVFTFAGSMNTARFIHTATLLNNGQVLIAGGNGDGSVVLDSAELYDPSMGTFTPTGSLNIARQYQTATLLSNGTVLIAGGEGGPDDTTVFSEAELYDPSTGTFTFTGSLGDARQDHTATLLNNGQVLVVGGVSEEGFLNSAELYDPSTGTFTQTGNLTTARQYHTATLLNNGMVLIVGGYNTGAPQFALSSAELYDPSTGIFTPTGSLNTGRDQHTATLLNNGMVLIAGGQDSTTTISSAELYDAATGTFTLVGSLNKDREDHTATLLSNGTGQVLITGGWENFVGPLASAELFVPATLTPTNLVSIAITPAMPTLSTGGTQQFIATGIFSDSSTEQLASVTWSSSDATIAQISNDASNLGTAIAIAPGTVTITATAGGVSGSVALTVGP